ncbi:hypothetical protein N9L47_13405 [Rhodobacteraceae bacterium]|nr:hypothetical protein [Paracoccaceae bacterium]
MSARMLYQTIVHVSGLLRELEDVGVRVEIGDDFSQYRNYRNGQTDRAGLYSMFDAASSYIDASNGFWICGFDDADNLIHSQAARLLDFGTETLGHHLDVHRHMYITPDTTPDPSLTYYRGPAALKSISGKVCYNGDFWLASRGLGGPRSQGATSLLSRIQFEIMNWVWEPDFTFALVSKQLASKGAHLRYGYTHCEPGQWIGPDLQVTDEEYLIWMSANDISNALSKKPASSSIGMAVSSVRPLATVKSKD